jgi:hypothetical protein
MIHEICANYEVEKCHQWHVLTHYLSMNYFKFCFNIVNESLKVYKNWKCLISPLFTCQY